jgi:hypothetical protein
MINYKLFKQSILSISNHNYSFQLRNYISISKVVKNIHILYNKEVIKEKI